MNTITFSYSGAEGNIKMEFEVEECDVWDKQAVMFFRFLEAQGFVIDHEKEFSRESITGHAYP